MSQRRVESLSLEAFVETVPILLHKYFTWSWIIGLKSVLNPDSDSDSDSLPTFNVPQAKQILAWSPTPREALRIALKFNNKYEIDGRGPNAFAGVMWCFGLKDKVREGARVRRCMMILIRIG